MSGFTPRFDPADPATSVRDGIVPAPGNVDGTAAFLRADGTWALTKLPASPPPAPGPALNQWACNVAGWLTYTVLRYTVKRAVDLLPVTWIGDVVGGVVSGLLDVLLPGAILADGLIDTIIVTFVTTHVEGYLTDFATAVLDDVFWAKVHCRLYDAIAGSPSNLQTALLAAGITIAAIGGYASGFFTGLVYLLQHLGLITYADLPIQAVARNYDCSSCAITGIGPSKALLQDGFDLTVTDGTTSEPFTDTITFAHATISGTAPSAVHTPTTSTVVALGINRPDNATIGVSAGVYAVLNGQLATINLDQYGAVAASASSGVTISSLTVGKTYALENTGSAYIYDNAGDTALSFDVSVDGSTWQGILDYGVTGFLVGPIVTRPTWGLSAAMTDSQHARVVWVATGTSVRFRASATDYSQASGTLGWQLLDVVYEGSEILVQHGGTKVATRPVLDFVDSSTVVATVQDDSANDRVTVSLAATAPGGGSVGTVTSVSGTAPVAVATGTTTPVISVGVFDGHGGSHPTGLVPDPGSGGATTTFLRADGTYTVPPGTGGSGTVTSVSGTAPITVATGTTTPVIALTTPLSPAYGGTGLDTSAVDEGDLLVGTSSHTWVRGGIGGGSGITVSELGGIFTVSASGSGAGGTGFTLLNSAEVTAATAASISVAPPNSGQSHLYLVLELRGDTATDLVNVLLRLNSDSGAHYNWQNNYGSGATAAAQQSILGTSAQIGWMPASTAPAGEAATIELWLWDYNGTNWRKHGHARHHYSRQDTSTFLYASQWGFTWTSTAAITALLFLPGSGNFVQHSKVWVYGTT